MLHVKGSIQLSRGQSEWLFVIGTVSLPEFLETEMSVDIALNTFPYNGGYSSLHILWMGIPLVSKENNSEFGKGGLALLGSVGLPDLCVKNADDYIEQAVLLAADINKINAKRKKSDPI
jgi:predicted O-linked N-acetylglucosamine transferase (SPINDLY family)